MSKGPLLGVAAVLAFCATTAMAQDYPAHSAPSPGMASPDAVNPARDASGPYLHAGLTDFYHPMMRERVLQARVQAQSTSGGLSQAQAVAADRALHRVVVEDREQVARHGRLRDWDRERLNDMMNHVVTRFSVLKS